MSNEERERALAEYWADPLNSVGTHIDAKLGYRAGYDAATAKAQERIAGLEKGLEVFQRMATNLEADLAAARGVIERIHEWTLIRGAALKPRGADSYGEGVRDCKDQVQSMVAALSTPPPVHEMPGAVPLIEPVDGDVIIERAKLDRLRAELEQAKARIADQRDAIHQSCVAAQERESALAQSREREAALGRDNEIFAKKLLETSTLLGEGQGYVKAVVNTEQYIPLRSLFADWLKRCEGRP